VQAVIAVYKKPGKAEKKIALAWAKGIGGDEGGAVIETSSRRRRRRISSATQIGVVRRGGGRAGARLVTRWVLVERVYQPEDGPVFGGCTSLKPDCGFDERGGHQRDAVRFRKRRSGAT